jgi:prepilin-type N-terminal cleavage/methylation domain-containing protein
MSHQSQSKDRNRLKSENGFTLIETVMSISILSLGIIAYGVTSESTVDNSIESPRKSVTTPIDQELDNFIVEGDAADDSRNQYGTED